MPTARRQAAEIIRLKEAGVMSTEVANRLGIGRASVCPGAEWMAQRYGIRVVANAVNIGGLDRHYAGQTVPLPVMVAAR